MRKERTLTYERLCELLYYDEETDYFYHRVTRWKSTIKPGTPTGKPGTYKYRRIKIDGIEYSMQEIVWLWTYKKWPDGILDHKDCDPFNNRPDNLRECTRSQNQANRRMHKNNRTGFKRVTERKRRRSDGYVIDYNASIQVEGVPHNLGYYSTPEEAHAAYLEAANKFYGEFARG